MMPNDDTSEMTPDSPDTEAKPGSGTTPAPPTPPAVSRGMGDSNMIDPTPGWVPFVVVLGMGVLLIFVLVFAAILLP